jgi:N-acetylmuramoyl-L-alanine amidase
MRKIYLSAGHSSKIGKNSLGKTIDNGASGNGYSEGILTAELRKLVAEELIKLGIKPITDTDDSIFTQTINYFRNLTDSKSIVCEFHWNSANPQAKGTETLIPAKYTEFEWKLAEALSDVVASTLNIPLRGKKGVKTEIESAHKKLLWMSLTGENVLMEICFISNKSEMESYQKNKEILAKKIALVLYRFSKEDNIQSSNTYTVKSGDTLSKIAKNNNTTVEKIKKENNLSSDIIKIGQKIKI